MPRASTSNVPAATPAEWLAEQPKERKEDLAALHDLIRKAAPGLKPCVHGGMLGYGLFHYRYASGREGDTPLIALSSRARYISLYVCAVDGGKYVAEEYKSALPKADIGKSCVRFKRLADVDAAVIGKLIQHAARVGGAGAA